MQSIANPTVGSPALGMTRDNFLVHTQDRINDEMNKYIQKSIGGVDAAGVDEANILALKADGKIFKKIVAGPILNTAIPTGNAIIEVIQKEGNLVGSPAPTTLDTNVRYLGYSNDVTGDFQNKPEVKAYDMRATMDETDGHAPLVLLPQTNHFLKSH